MSLGTVNICQSQPERSVQLSLSRHLIMISIAKVSVSKYGFSDATFYKWRSKYGGMEISDARRLKSLEDENNKLKKLLAEQVLNNSTLNEMLAKKLLTP